VQQLWICVNPVCDLLVFAGLFFSLRNTQYRLLALLAIFTVLLFAISQGRSYYPAAVYPSLFAVGSVFAERWLARLKSHWRITTLALYFTLFTIVSAYMVARILPIAASGPLRQFTLSHNGDLREELGWPELISTAAHVRDSLPPNQQRTVGIVASNYGELGAAAILGPAYHLPAPLSGSNTAWLRGYPTPPPEPLIVLGFSPKIVARLFSNCRIAAHIPYPNEANNEESNWHPDIFLCDSPLKSWPEFWNDIQDYQ
jgi:hypothetical protein